ncbi:Uncharacterised protein r2_g3387 [Pycnogonum litorale]
MAYRTTPHRATGESPALLFYNRNLRTKLPCFENVKAEKVQQRVEKHYKKYVSQMKAYTDAVRKAKVHSFKPGDIVYVAQFVGKSKLSSTYSTTKHVIISTVCGNSFKLVNVENGNVLHRNAKHLRHAPDGNISYDFDSDFDFDNEPNNDILSSEVNIGGTEINKTMNDSNVVTTRRSNRTSKPPVKFQDYVLY